MLLANYPVIFVPGAPTSLLPSESCDFKELAGGLRCLEEWWQGWLGAIPPCLPQTQHISQKNRRPAQPRWSSFSPSSKAWDFQHGRTNELASYLPHLPEALSHDILIPLWQEQAARGGFIAPTQCLHNPSTLCTVNKTEKKNTSSHN